jgi:hypothetical protein
MSTIADFISKVQDACKTGIAREHAYRPALHDLLKELGDDLTPVNDPTKSEVGAPDFIVLRGEIQIGHLRRRISTSTFASSRTPTRTNKTATRRALPT